MVDDRVQTFITVPDASDRAVIQFVDKAGKTEVVNYELENGVYVIQNKVLRPGEKFRLVLIEKAMAAPVTAIVAHDLDFALKMPELFPARPEMKDYLATMPSEKRDAFVLQNASLQAGYFIMAARALGLDCGPMGGFDAAKVDAAFFPEGRWHAILLVNLGYGDESGLYPRNPRLASEDATRAA